MNAADLVRLPVPVWSVSISNDPITQTPRLFQSDGLYIASWGITLRGLVYFLNPDGSKITAGRFQPYLVELTAGLTIDGPFIDPNTLLRVYPDANGNLPDGTILRYDALMSMIDQNVNINSEVLAFITSADADGEFNI